MKKPEILAPVGNLSMLYGAIAANADSFYLGLDDFSARAYAENFTIENIEEIIDYIHLFGKKIYITINTLIKDFEMEKVISNIEKLYKYGVDGLIIQDIGLFSIIKDKFPNLKLHASTQMAVRDYYGAKYLYSIGFDRIVIARECPIEEIKKIKSLPIEIEVFVHGSLCVSYSGECLMSSYFGGRSANRGRCAGPCRQKYQLISDGKKFPYDYYLNMKDLNTIDKLDKLIELEVDSIKIEGRMKTPEYVHSVAKNYRSKIDENFYDEDELSDSSNRQFTQGFIFDQKNDYVSLKDSNKHRIIGKVLSDKGEKYFISNSSLEKEDILEITTDKGKKLPFTTTKSYEKKEKIFLKKYKDALVGSNVLLLNSKKLSNALKDDLNSYRNLPVSLYFKANIGEYPQITLTYKDISLSYEGDSKVEKAEKIAINKEDIKENLEKFTDEIFSPTQISIDIDENIFIRKKDINQCRRSAIKLLENEILKDYKRRPVKISLPDIKNGNIGKRERNIELLTNDISPKLLKDFDNIYLRTYDKKYQGNNIYLILDSHEDYEIDKLIDYIKENEIKGVIFNNYRDLNFINDFRENNIEIRIGRYLNVFNSYSFDFYGKFAQRICSSVENDLTNINKNSKNFPVEALVYGRIELMTMRHCPFSLIKKCRLKGCETCKFNNAYMKSFDDHYLKVIRYGNYSKIYPKEIQNYKIDKFAKEVSFLYSVMSDEDILNVENTRIKNSYEKGVI